jgi:hypothetical protein
MEISINVKNNLAKIDLLFLNPSLYLTIILLESSNNLKIQPSRTMCNRNTHRLLKSNSNVGHFSNNVLPQKLTQKLYITINDYLTY